jgi:riboflavin synthase
MFTGIVQGKGRVLSADARPGGVRLVIALPPRAAHPIEPGASVAINGTCLTFVEGAPAAACFDVIEETLRVTTLGGLREGDAVNVERAARFGDEIGGHLLSGHISGRATVVERIATETAFELRLQLDPGLADWVLPKGFVGLDGCSLTVGPTVSGDGRFSVYLIPETLRVTTLGDRAPGDRLNVELDAMTQAVVDTVRRVLERRTSG